MKYEINYKRAIELISSCSKNDTVLNLQHSEFLASVTHWIQSPDTIPTYGNKAVREKWIKALSAFSGKNALRRPPSINFSDIPFPPPDKPRFTFIDLFAGIGGFRIALQTFGGKCIFSSEWDAAAKKTYLNNFAEYPFGDIKQFTDTCVSDAKLKKLIPDHHILAAGFPCQPFSHAGVSARRSLGQHHGFACQTQGTLFFEILRIAKVKKPKVLLLENVKNLRRHDSGRTFDLIKKSIEELGYDFEAAVIDASSLVPQHRERCYIVCFRKDLKVKFKFPVLVGKPLKLKSILEGNPAAEFTISDRLWKGHIDRTKRNIERGTGFTAFAANLEKPSNTIVARYGKDGKECLIPQSGENPRLLTPRECARLQGFPETFIFPSSRTPAYRQFGNSVAVPVVKMIAKEILKYL